MRILFLLPQIPYPPHSGGRIVTWNTVSRFAAEHETHVACLYHSPDELKHLETVRERCASVEAFPARAKWDIPVMLRSLASAWPYKAHRFFNPRMADYVREKAFSGDIDVIHAQNFYTAAYVRGDEPCLRVHYKENVEGNVLLRYSRASRNPAVKAAAWAEGMRTRSYEARSCRKFHRILCISPLDRDALLRLDPSLPAIHQTPGVDRSVYPYLNEASGPPRVVFTGTMSYYPNADGVRMFLRESWPLVKTQVPEAECWIVGAAPPEDIASYDGTQGVRVTGRVDDIGEYIESASVYIVPLRIGGGIRLKILEAMASGRAIVSTSVGCEGLNVKPGEHLRVEDEPASFARAVIELLSDRAGRDALRERARSLIEDVYDWDAIIPRQAQAYQSWLHLLRSEADRPA